MAILVRTRNVAHFPFSVFQDAIGYFIKSHLGYMSHQYHPCHDYLHHPISLLTEEANQLQADLNSARAKLGDAAKIFPMSALIVQVHRLFYPKVRLSTSSRRTVLKKEEIPAMMTRMGK
jgi:hypothetical protein